MTMYTFETQGICAKYINIELDGDIIKEVQFAGGCPGNLAAIPKLVAGHTVDEIATLLEGNRCGNKPTSCADQMVRGMRAIQEYEATHPNGPDGTEE
jgi:uncharacterized protein (TIGR03905 family)